MILLKRQFIPLKRELIMNKESLNLIKKLSTMILFFSITSLIFISFLPWITVETNGDNGIKYMNLEMIETSNNDEISKLSGPISLLSILLWTVILLAFISLFGAILYLTKKCWILANILIFVGFFIAILFAAILIYDVILLNNINDAKGVSLATFLGPLGYVHILFLFNISPFMISLYYSVNAISFAIEYFSENKKRKKYFKKSERYVSKRKALPTNKEISDSKTLSHKKYMVTEGWNQKSGNEEEILITSEKSEDKIEDDSDLNLKQVETSYFEGKKIDLDKKHGRQGKKEVAEKEIEVKPVSEKKKEIEKVEKTKDDEVEKEPEDLKQNLLDQSFEKALISAIEKRKNIKNGKITLTKSDDTNTKDKKEDKFEEGAYTVKCARCGHIFTAELKNKGDKIKCPECGKEGSVK